MELRLDDCTFSGHALPEPFVRFDLEGLLQQAKLFPKTTGQEGRALSDAWESYRRRLGALGNQGGPARVASHVLEPLAARLGYATFRRDGAVVTREGEEDGGYLFETQDGSARLRAFAVDMGADLDAPTRRGQAYRYSPSQVAQRVLLARGERVALLTDGHELRLLFCDPARRESHISVRLDRAAGGWRGARAMPVSYVLLLALCGPPGVAKIPDLVERARVAQTRVTAELRKQARSAVQAFVQEVLDDPRNAAFFARYPDKHRLAGQLYRDALVMVYRLLFILKLEASPDPARSFSFASVTLWRNTYSPTNALAKIVEEKLRGGETGEMVSGSLRALFRLFREGFQWSEMRIHKLGGMLFGEDAAPLLDDEGLRWSELAAAKLLGHLLWTPRSGKDAPMRVHYGPLYVEDLGRVYEALLELEPGIATEPMCRLRRQKLEVVVPLAQGEPYRQSAGAGADAEGEGEEAAEDEAEDEDEKPARGKTRVQWIEEIPAGAFYLRVGLGRKATGSYYTPQAFVKFLIQETLGPQVAERSPAEDPRPAAILELKVLDPAMGSGHFLVEACRFLGDKLYEACRLCDGKAKEAEEKAEKTASGEKREALLSEAAAWRQRVVDLPDPSDEMLAYLPSRVGEGEESGLSDAKAQALCRRLAAVHCLYGVDKNPLAVELAKLSLWLESYAEGLPLTFLDHRLICGDSLTGPFFADMGTWPVGKGEVRDLFSQRLTERLAEALGEALVHVRDLEASVGKDVADVEAKRAAKRRLDEALTPFKTLAAAWSGGVMLGAQGDDEGYRALMEAVAGKGDVGAVVAGRAALGRMVEVGREGVAYDLVFPEVFYPEGRVGERRGFHAVVGNPPWDAVRRNDDQFFAGFEFSTLDLSTKAEKKATIQKLLQRPEASVAYDMYVEGLEAKDRCIDNLYKVHKARVNNNLAGRGVYDDFMLFAERAAVSVRAGAGCVGLVLPSGFHANEGAVGVRRMYLDELSMVSCFSFENRKKLFEIDSRFKFAVVVATRGAASPGFACAFYLHDPEWLFDRPAALRYTREFVSKSSGEHLSFLELRSVADYDVARQSFGHSELFGAFRRRLGIVTSQELNMTYDSGRFLSTQRVVSAADDCRLPVFAGALRGRGYVPLHEGKTFHQYQDRWDERPRYMVVLSKVADKPGWVRAAQHFRMAFRDIARSNDERTGIFCMLPPGVLVGNTAPVERAPWDRHHAVALELLATSNSYSFDWHIRQKAAAHVNLFILDGCPLPPSAFERPRSVFLAHSALRLTCNHEGYAPLWREQLGDAWREPTPRHTWPVLAGDDARWAVRAAIDAVVADAYGLTRDQYAHVLSTFSHKSYPRAPERCLAAFDDLRRDGLDAFLKAHDPYADIPLNESLPRPVIDLPIPGAAAAATTTAEGFQLQPSEPKKRARKKGG